MRRLFVNSTIETVPTDSAITGVSQDIYIIQVEQMTNFWCVEYCKHDEVVDLIPFDSVVKSGYNQPQTKPQSDQEKIAEYRAIVLNKDPFAKYSGKTLGEIIDSNDEAWYSKVVSQMRNEFIRTRLQYLHDHKSEDDGLPF